MSAGGYGSPDPYGAPLGPPGPLDGLFADKNKVLLIVLAVCPCTAGIMLILAIIAFFSAKLADAKANAKLILIINAVIIALEVILVIAFGGLGLILGGGR